jgi:hypothetical protein
LYDLPVIIKAVDDAIRLINNAFKGKKVLMLNNKKNRLDIDIFYLPL